jgi:hypothetical protein
MTTIDIGAALDKARIKRRFAKDLEALPRSAQRDILADLLAELEEDTEQVVLPDQARGQPPKPTTNGKASPPVAAEPKATVRPVKPAPLPSIEDEEDETEEDGEEGATQTHRGAVWDALRSSPGLPIKDIAKAVYGVADETHVGRIRAILSALKRQRRVKSTGFGKWEAVPLPK